MNDKCEDMCMELRLNPDSIRLARECMIADDEAVKLSEVFKLLGDPTRVRIIDALSRCELCVCDIAEVLEMTQSAISHQLRLMRNLKVVKFRKEGKSVFYSLDDEHIMQLFGQGMEHIRHT